MSHQVDTQTVLDDLVHQFSDPHAFFRELIQNAIDAGSGEVDIRFAFEEGEGDEGVMTAHIDDFGEGMSREIIETKLTRLFSSGKDNDFTKIGRFGIGFVSVFAIEPDAVCVDTGHAGVYWRVLFHQDRSFDLISMSEPVEGTRIRVFKTMTREAYTSFVARATEVVTHWCKHVQVPIFIQDEEINEPFAIESICQVRYEEEGTRVVLGFVPENQVPYGFYNRGLTLKEGEECPWPHVHLKIDSRYLEHTLTRDQVLQDRHYHKAMDLLRRLAEEELPRQLLDQLVAAARKAHTHPDAYDALATLMLGYLGTFGELDTEKRRWDIIPMMYGAPVSSRELRARARVGEVFWASERTHLSGALQEEVLILPTTGPRGLLYRLASVIVGGPISPLHESFVMPEPVQDHGSPEARALGERARVGIQALGGRPEWVGLGGLGMDAGMAVCLEDRRVPTRTSRVPSMGKGALQKARHVVLNADDVRVRKLLMLARTEPEFAGMMLLKMLLLTQGLDPRDDVMLMQDAVACRQRREEEGSR